MRPHVYVTGFSKDTDRQTLLNKFRKFGEIDKFFLHPSGNYAKVYYADTESADLAVREVNSTTNWTANYNLENYVDGTSTQNMAYYNGPQDYEDEFTENFEYCTIHGKPLTVLQSDNGDIYVNLNDIKKTGFAIFRRNAFDPLLVDSRQIGKEFDLFLLSQAEKYIRQNNATSIDEEQILQTIERCKNKLLGNNHDNNRSVSYSSSKNFTITAPNLQQPEAQSTAAQDAAPFNESPQNHHSRTPRKNFTSSPNQRVGFNREPISAQGPGASNDTYQNNRQRYQGQGASNDISQNNRQRYQVPDASNDISQNKRQRYQVPDASNDISQNIRQRYQVPDASIDISQNKRQRYQVSDASNDTSQNKRQRPKVLPNNFVPTHTQREGFKPKGGAAGNRDRSRGPRNHFEDNDCASNNNSKNESWDLNSSSSSETRSNVRKPRDFYSVNKAQWNQNQKPVRENIESISFEIGSTYKVSVTYKERDNIYWVQDNGRMTDFEDVTLQLNALVKDLEPIEPAQGQFVAAEYEGMWNRGRVAQVDPLTVHFIDFGNKSAVESVRPLPDSLKTVPKLAVRVALDAEQTINDDDTDITIKIKKQYEKGTYLAVALDSKYQPKGGNATSSKLGNNSSGASSDNLVETVTEKVTPKPEPPKSYFNVPKPLSQLRDGDRIMLVEVVDNRFAVKTKDCAMKSKELTDYIKNLDRSAVTLNGVKVGQLVLCSRDGFATLFRAVITRLENESVAEVKYIDFPGEATLLVRSLRNVDSYLAEQPSTLLMTPEYKRLEGMSVEVEEYISKICQQKEKFKVIITKDKFDLEHEDGTLLSESIDNLVAPKPGPSKVVKTSPPEAAPAVVEKPVEAVTPTEIKTSPPVKEDKILYDDMDWIKMDEGVHSLMCYCLQDINDITFISTSEEVLLHLEVITGLDPSEEEPYEPEVTEMCLVLYKGPEDDEATWYRAVVTSIEKDEYVVSFVDFGNSELTPKKNVRKFPAHLKAVPILGIACECVDIPKKPEILKRLKELMPEGQEVEVKITKFDGLTYQIELPQIYKQLKAEKLF